jgi:hypothetical protein
VANTHVRFKSTHVRRRRQESVRAAARGRSGREGHSGGWGGRRGCGAEWTDGAREAYGVRWMDKSGVVGPARSRPCLLRVVPSSSPFLSPSLLPPSLRSWEGACCAVLCGSDDGGSLFADSVAFIVATQPNTVWI